LERSKTSDPCAKFGEHDSILNERFATIKKQIHAAFCDSINTPTITKNIGELISATNNYIDTPNTTLNGLLLRNIGVYMTGITNVFG